MDEREADQIRLEFAQKILDNHGMLSRGSSGGSRHMTAEDALLLAKIGHIGMMAKDHGVTKEVFLANPYKYIKYGMCVPDIPMPDY